MVRLRHTRDPNEASQHELDVASLQEGDVRNYGKLLKLSFPGKDVRPVDFLPERSVKRGRVHHQVLAPIERKRPPQNTRRHKPNETRSSTLRPVKSAVTCLDYGFFTLGNITQVLSTRPREQRKLCSCCGEGKYQATTLNLGGCGLRDVQQIASVVPSVLHRGLETLTVLNLALNHITDLPDSIAELQALVIFNIQANDIAKVSVILKLAPLKSLQVLSTSGNPCEESKHYREAILRALPSLRSLNATTITKLDRDVLSTCPSRLPPCQMKLLNKLQPNTDAEKR